MNAKSSLPPSLHRLEQEAIVTATISPQKAGRVKFKGSWWSARCEQNIMLQPGEIVYVTGIYNLTLLVALQPA
ncbi:NfeD family protein [Phormidium sp. FACHB-592]|uniref:NfeD family protein n=1 Tax=Stenomitos frigidus AS-A4 TaxID=2933935 RepID=A0ABV0KR25_9CYAN|nr:NfeD family protein [Phormidium sp. FACHB-592]MBD2075886.1 NfeD family protein [Phormidium sp. FACHB-592]